MSTSTETSALDLALMLEKLICPADAVKFSKPVYRDSVVCVTNGQIAVTLNCSDRLDHWVKNKELVELIKSVTSLDGAIDFDLPQIDTRAVWLEPNKAIKSQCPECDATGVVVCEYDHEHDCPDCGGDGCSTNLAIDEWNNVLAKERGYQTPIGLFDRRYLWIISELAKHRDLTYACQSMNGGMMLAFRFRDGFGAVMSILCREDV